ncbi:Hypothetical predicted protein [Paramuricea clavata]|uniref:Uncharacterized protein n=1 Tax=Paramuricea clavata TaxID=317549 RepID=A0A6S7ILD7_PARCT|nr:Hypothetical predicted protein [Paramuricea clavata]
MPLPTHLDAENKDLFMRVLNISYPLTIENVKKDTCGVHIKLCFPTTSHLGIEIKYEMDMMHLPAGYYTLEKLINVLNSYVSEYDIQFSILPSVGTSIVGSIFGKKTAQRQAPSVNQPSRQRSQQPPPQWMTDRPRQCRRQRHRYDYDDNYY